MRRVRVLIVEEREAPVLTLSAALGSLGCDCEVARGAAQAKEILQRSSVEAIVVVTSSDEGQGRELIGCTGRAEQAAPVVVVARGGTVRGAVEAIKQGAFDYLVGPVEPAEVRSAIERAMAASALLPTPPSLATIEPDPEIFLGEDVTMLALKAFIDQVSRSSAPVLLLGESGTGKEMVARAIHRRSPRRDRAFVAVNAAAIPEHLLESELFGHVKGAFTGANRTHSGLLQQANGGTLLLDEIGDMPLALQAKLLRVLQEGEVRPVGSDTTYRVDVRVIAATHRDLQQMAHRGLFREDLYFRLNVIPLFIPPLRQRKGDIPLLARSFLAQARTRSPSSPVRDFSPDAMQLLQEASWQGNVRELASTIERFVVLGSTEMIGADFLRTLMPNAAKDCTPKGHEQGTGGDSFTIHMPDAPWSLKKVSASYIAWVFAKTEGNKMHTAQLLGINLSTLYRWVKALQPNPPRPPPA